MDEWASWGHKGCSEGYTEAVNRVKQQLNSDKELVYKYHLFSLKIRHLIVDLRDALESVRPRFFAKGKFFHLQLDEASVHFVDHLGLARHLNFLSRDENAINVPRGVGLAAPGKTAAGTTTSRAAHTSRATKHLAMTPC